MKSIGDGFGKIAEIGDMQDGNRSPYGTSIRGAFTPPYIRHNLTPFLSLALLSLSKTQKENKETSPSAIEMADPEKGPDAPPARDLEGAQEPSSSPPTTTPEIPYSIFTTPQKALI